MRFSKEEKTMWVADWQQSGKSVWAYAKANGLCPQTFARWTKPKTESKECFVEVPAFIESPLRHNQEILIEKEDMKIHIPLALGHRELSAIFGALGQTV